jgi:uncharacterized protein YgbK (DUF1537 family)
LSALDAEGECMVVVDAVEDRDLMLIAQARGTRTASADGRSGGLANALPVSFFMQEQQTLPVLVVAGSMSEATRRQVDRALYEGRAEVVDIDASRLISSSYALEYGRASLRPAQSPASYDLAYQSQRGRSTSDREFVWFRRDKSPAAGGDA